MATNPRHLFQQDNASRHASAYTKLWLSWAGIEPLLWPPFSPDLNPIETVWNWLKDALEAQNPIYHTLHAKLKTVIEHAWDMIKPQQIQELVSGASMRARCQAVIDAKGGHTKY